MPSVLTNALWTTVTVEVAFRDRILGGTPKQGKPLDFFLESKGMSDAEAADFRERIKKGELSDDEKAEMAEANWCCFEHDKKGNLCVWHGNIKAMLREAFATRPDLLKGMTEAAGLKFYGIDKKHHLQVGVDLEPLRPLFFRDGAALAEPDGCLDKVKHLIDKKFQQPMSALGRHDYLDKPTLAFELRWLKKSPFSLDDMMSIFALCESIGLGACRSQGYGKFETTKFDVSQ